MKQGPIVFLRGVILLTGAGMLAAMVRFPQTEGRAADLDLIRIYADPLIIYGYLASIPFFVALYQAFKLLGYVDTDQFFSPRAVKAVRIIRYCALAMPVLIAAGEAFIVVNATDDDFAGPVALGIAISFVSIVIAVVAVIFERLLQSAVDLKSKLA
jgi:hypothetical protein